MRTIIEHTNSNGHTRQIDADEAALLLGMYPLAYYSFAHDVNGGHAVAISADYRGGKICQITACKLDDGTSRGSWLSAACGAKRTAKDVLIEWTRLAETRKALAV